MKHTLYKFSLAVAILGVYIACNSKAAGQTTAKKPVSADVKATGNKVYTSTCSACHTKPASPKTPTLVMLQAMEPRVILNILDNGKMRQQASGLTEKQREAVAQFITDKVLKTTVLPKDAFTAFSFNGRGDTLHDYSGWGGNLAGTGFRTTAQSGITPENVNTLQLKWAFAFPDANEMRSKPAVAGDWLIIGSESGEVYALNRKTGKIGWHVTATSSIRGGIVVAKDGNAVTAYFADGATYVYAVNVKTGKVLWSTHAGVDPLAMNTGTLVVYKGKVFVPLSSLEVVVAYDSKYKCCTSSGGVAALDGKTGTALWYHRVIADSATAQGKKKDGKPFFGPSGAPVWCSPTVDAKRNLLYIGTGENYSLPTTNTSDAIQAINMTTGKLAWNFQGTQGDAWNIACPVIVNCPGSNGKDFDFGMAPVLVTGEDGKDRLLAGQKAGIVYALDPNNGKLLWKTRVGKGGMLGGVHWGMATDGRSVYAAVADNQFGLNMDDSTIHATPGIYALDVVSGKIGWYSAASPVPGKESYLGVNSAAPAVTPGIVFAGSNDGHLRAYSTTDGHILWDYNTMQKYTGVNGLEGKGGSIDCPAPVMSDGMLFVNSGYAQFGEKPGNVLLAFEVKK